MPSMAGQGETQSVAPKGLVRPPWQLQTTQLWAPLTAKENKPLVCISLCSQDLPR